MEPTTNPLIQRFQSEIPSWFPEVKEIAMGKISALPLVQACARGDKEAAKLLLAGFAAFIEQFPEHIDQATRVMVRRKHLTPSQKEHFRPLLKKVSRLLPSIRKDELEHRLLWIKSSEALGISEDSYLRNADMGYEVPDMQELLALTGDSSVTGRTLVRFAAVEIVAEALSRTVLASDEFRALMGTTGLGWFKVHAEHHGGGETHETLVLKLAFSLLRREKQIDRPADPNPIDVGRWIQETADAFVKVANECYLKVTIH